MTSENFTIYQFKNESIQADVAELVTRYVPGSRFERFQVRTLNTKEEKN